MGNENMSAAQAVETLIYDYGRLVFQVIYGLTGDWQESQDLTQDTFMQIAVNTVRMQRRRRSLVRFVPFSSLHEERQEACDGELVGERLAPVQPVGYGMGGAERDPAEIIAERDVVQRTMTLLPETLRLCLLLSVVKKLSSREIASLLHLGEAAVRQRLTRARKVFQRLYLLESGESIVDGSSQTEARDQRRMLAVRSSSAMIAGSP